MVEAGKMFYFQMSLDKVIIGHDGFWYCLSRAAARWEELTRVPRAWLHESSRGRAKLREG